MHDVFMVTSEGSGGGHIVRTVYAASEDDAHQTHQENHADQPCPTSNAIEKLCDERSCRPPEKTSAVGEASKIPDLVHGISGQCH